MAKRVRTGKRGLRTAERRARALEYRKDGWSYDQIAAKLGISRQAAWKLVADELRSLRETTAETRAELRELMLGRLERAHEALMPSIKAGDARAIDTEIRLQARIAALHGLDAPTKTELSGPNGGPLEVQNPYDLSKLSNDELRVWQRLVQKAKAAQ